MSHLAIKVVANGVAYTMLRFPRIDRVVLALPVSKEWFSAIIDNLEFICQQYGYQRKKKYILSMQCWDAVLTVGNEILRVSIRQAYQYTWIAYSFKGEIDFAAFQERLLLLQEYGLGNAIAQGRVKRLELAVDLPGLHTSMFICHCSGMHTGFVKCNAAGTGVSFYLGSRNGRRQFVMYDKNQQLRDTGKDPGPGDLLRIELRLYDADFPLAFAVEGLKASDPFKGFYFAYKAAMLSKVTKISTWGILISTCIQNGSPAAVKLFPEQKKTFLNHLKAQSLSGAPRLKDFLPALARILAATKALHPIDEAGLPLPL